MMITNEHGDNSPFGRHGNFWILRAASHEKNCTHDMMTGMCIYVPRGLLNIHGAEEEDARCRSDQKQWSNLVLSDGP
jgi:hypothetical protein